MRARLLATAAGLTVLLVAAPGPAQEAPASPPLDANSRRLLHEGLKQADSFKARIQAAILLGRRGNVVDDLPVLAEALDMDRHYTVRGASAMAIGNLGDPRGIEHLFAGLADEEPFVRRASREAAFKLAGSKAVPYLALARERPEPNVRMVAVELLGGLDEPDARRALSGFLGDSDSAVREQVQRSVTGWDRDAAVEAIIEALDHDSYRVRAHAAELAGTLEDPRCLGPLAARLASPLETEPVVNAASQSLQSLKGLIDVEDQVKRVQGLVDRNARIPSIILLGFTGGPRATEVLSRTLEDPDLKIRYYAVRALGRSGDASVVGRLETMVTSPENARIKTTIQHAIRDLGGS